MKKTLSILIVVAIIAFFGIIALPAIAQTTTSATPIDYELLTGEVPGLSESITFAGFLQSLFKLALGSATVLAVLIIVIGGFTYMTSDSFSGKKSGIEMLNNAVIGLLIALGAWLILYTINPDLLNFDLSLPVVDTPATESEGEGIPSGNCPACAVIPSNVQVKPTACRSTTGCKVAPTLVGPLSGLAEDLDDVNWRVTEAWPPTKKHQNACHLNGTCVDANFNGSSASASNINKFIEAATRNNLTACYEVSTSAQKTSLTSAGVDPADIDVVPGINAPHFSVYGYRTSCN